MNAKLVAAGKKTVGFVNPTLYAYPSYFNDIVYTSNLCDKSASQATSYSGFEASIGWDPVSGMYLYILLLAYIVIFEAIVFLYFCLCRVYVLFIMIPNFDDIYGSYLNMYLPIYTRFITSFCYNIIYTGLGSIQFENLLTLFTDPPPQPSSSTSKKKTLSAGAVAGIVIAVLIIVGGLGLIIYFKLRRNGGSGSGNGRGTMNFSKPKPTLKAPLISEMSDGWNSSAN